MSKKRRILIIYTGGTIGMVQDSETGALSPFNFENLMEAVPGLRSLDIFIESYCFQTLIDSSDMGPDGWIHIAQVIEKNDANFDGFVVLHGTDTMAYTASALSFMLENLQKPLILTGSQLPIGVLRSDGKDNLINAFEMASAVDSCGEPMVREVCVCFGSKLFRGNRITKFSAENFTAFISANFPAVAKVGVHVKWTLSDYRCLCAKKQALIVHSHLETQVIIIKVYPGMTPKVLNAMLHIENLKGVVLETYGSGNAPTSDAFIAELEDAIKRGIPILNVTQCADGSVEMGKYAASSRLREIGVVSGKDITTESAVTKMMYLLGLDLSFSEVCKLLSSSLRGEMTS